MDAHRVIAEDARGAATTRSQAKPRFGDRTTAFLFVAPALIILIALAIAPTIYLLRTSFTSLNLFQSNQATFVGWENFQSLLSQDLFWSSLLRLAIFVAVVVLAEFLLGFFIALLMFQRLRGISIFRTLFTTPILIAPIVAAMMWRYMYEPSYGVIDYLLGKAGVSGPPWLSDPATAFPAVMVVDIWQWTPFMVLILLAGLNGIPSRIIEAAELDGIGPARMIWYFVLPLMRRVILLAVLLRLIDALKTVDIIIGTTSGGPGTASFILPFYNWSIAFQQFDIGTASALSVLLLLGITVLITLFVRLIARQSIVGAGR